MREDLRNKFFANPKVLDNIIIALVVLWLGSKKLMHEKTRLHPLDLIKQLEQCYYLVLSVCLVLLFNKMEVISLFVEFYFVLDLDLILLSYQ